jgi:hypothetical protein
MVLFFGGAMATKSKKASQTTTTPREPNPYAARLARQDTQELASDRQLSKLHKKKARSAGK